MDAPTGIDFPDIEYEGENRTDPAVALVNMTPEEEIKAVEVTK